MLLSLALVLTGCSSKSEPTNQVVQPVKVIQEKEKTTANDLYAFTPEKALRELNHLLGSSSKLTILKQKDELISVGTFTPMDPNYIGIQLENRYYYVINLKTGSVMIDANTDINSEESSAISGFKYFAPVCHLLHTDRCLFQEMKSSKYEYFEQMNQRIHQEFVKKTLEENQFYVITDVIDNVAYTKEGYILVHANQRDESSSQSSFSYRVWLDPFDQKIIKKEKINESINGAEKYFNSNTIRLTYNNENLVDKVFINNEPHNVYGGYSVRDVSIISFDGYDESFILAESSANSGNLTGIRVFRYDNETRELKLFFSSESPTGSGTSELLDKDQNGKYDGYQEVFYDYDGKTMQVYDLINRKMVPVE